MVLSFMIEGMIAKGTKSRKSAAMLQQLKMVVSKLIFAGNFVEDILNIAQF